MSDIRYAIGIEADSVEETRIIKNPRRNSLCLLAKGVRFKTFTKRSSALKWITKIEGRGGPEGLTPIIVPEGWGELEAAEATE